MYYIFLSFCLRCLFISLLFFVPFSIVLPIEFIHQNDIVKKVQTKFQEIKGYKATFSFHTINSSNKNSKKGTIYYKHPHNLRVTFTSPSKDLIVSNGSTMWIYIHSLNSVGIQELSSQNKEQKISNNPMSIIPLFSKYHITFDKVEQPRLINDTYFYVLYLKEKIHSGSFSEIKLHIHAKQYLIYKLIAIKASEQKLIMELNNIDTQIPLENAFFNYKIKDASKIVKNPLTINSSK